MNLRRKSEHMRVPPRFKPVIRGSGEQRVKNQLDKTRRVDRDLLDMMMNTPSMPKVLKELETIPKREDLLKRKKC